MSKQVTQDVLDNLLGSASVASQDELDKALAGVAPPPPPPLQRANRVGLPNPAVEFDKTVDYKHPKSSIPSLSDVAMTPISKHILGMSLSEVVDFLAPGTPEEHVRAGLPAERAQNRSAAYDATRRTGKMVAGIFDFIQSPEALAAAAAEAVTAGGATPVIATLMGGQFVTQGTKEATVGLEDIRKNGITPENTEQFLTGLLIAEGGFTGVAGVREARARARAATERLMANKAAIHDIISNSLPEFLEGNAPERAPRMNRSQRRGTVEVPESATQAELDAAVAGKQDYPRAPKPPDIADLLSDEELEMLTRPDAPVVQETIDKALSVPVEEPVTAEPVAPTEEPAAVTPEPSAPTVETAPQQDPEATLAQVDKLRENPIREKDPEVVRNSEFANYERQLRSFAAVHYPELIPELDEAITLHDNGNAGDALVKLEVVAQKFHELAKKNSRLQIERMNDPELLAEFDRRMEQGPGWSKLPDEARDNLLEEWRQGWRKAQAAKEEPVTAATPPERSNDVQRLFDDFQSHTKIERIIHDTVQMEMERFAADNADWKKPSAPASGMTFVDWIRQTKIRGAAKVRVPGGLKDFQGDLKSREPGAGIINNKSGMNLDDATTSAIENGYLPENATINDFMDLLDENISGRRTTFSTDYYASGGGLDEHPALTGFKESPKALAKAIRKKSGPLYESIQQALYDYTVAHHGEDIRKFADEGHPELHGLLGDDFIELKGGDSPVTLGVDEADAMRMAAAGRRTELLREGRQFDEQRLIDSELFEGRGGAQGFLPTDERGDMEGPEVGDISFDFGDSVIEALDSFETAQTEALKKSIASLAKGETFGANLPVEMVGRLVAIGAAKIAKGTVRFAQWSVDMVRDFGEEIRPHLESIYAKALESAAELRKFKPEEYFNFKRIDLSDAEKQNLTNTVIGTILETGRIPKERTSFEEIRKDAAKVGGEVASQLDPLQKAQPQYRAVRFAARQRINTLNLEVADARKKLTGLSGDELLAAEKAIDVKERDLRGLLDVWMRMRSEDGRNLVMHRMMADSTWDASYWLSRAKRSMGLTSNVELPPDVMRETGGILADGDAAATRVSEIIKRTADRGANAKPGTSKGQTELSDIRDKEPPKNLPELKGVISTIRGALGRFDDILASRKSAGGDAGGPTGPVETVFGEQKRIGEKALNLPDLEGKIKTLRGQLAELEGLTGKADEFQLPDLLGRLESIRGKVIELSDFLDKEPAPTFPALEGAVKTVRGYLAELEGILDPATGRSFPELKGAVDTIRGRIRELEDILDRESPPDLPELKGAVKTVQGVQSDILDIRNGLQDVNAAKRRLARHMGTLEKSGWLEILSSLRKAGLLTGIKTHLRNIGGNASFQVLEEVARIPAVVVDMALSIGTGKRGMQGPSPRGFGRASYEAATKGLRQAKEIMRSGATADEYGKVGVAREMNSGIKWLDKYANFVFRLMSAEDKVFKSYAFRRSLEEQAVIRAKNDGVSAVEVLARPSEQMISQAIADAEFSTFNNPNLVGSALRNAQSWLRTKGPVGKAVDFGIDLVVPFANTPANIISRMVDYTPIGAGVRGGYAVYSALASKAMTPIEQRAFSMALGRGLTGSALMFLGWKLAEKGLATGTTEEDTGARNVSQAAGRLPGSIRIGNRWHEIAPFSPMGNIVTIGATLQREATKPLAREAARVGKVAAVGTRVVLEQPMLKGLSDFVDAMKHPESSGESAMGSMVGSFVPTMVADVAAVFDPYMRDSRPETAMQSVYRGAQVRLPGLRNILPARKDVLGRAMEQSKTGGIDPTIGTAAKEMSDAVTRELLANKVSVGFPQRSPTWNKQETPAEFQARATLTGKLIDERVSIVIESPGYKAQKDPDMRKKLIDDAISNARDVGQALAKGAHVRYKDPVGKLKYLDDQIQRVSDRIERRGNRPSPQ